MTPLLWLYTVFAVRLRSDRGQSSVEYLGIVVVAATLIGLLITASTDWGNSITQAISAKIKEIAN